MGEKNKCRVMVGEDEERGFINKVKLSSDSHVPLGLYIFALLYFFWLQDSSFFLSFVF